VRESYPKYLAAKERLAGVKPPPQTQHISLALKLSVSNLPQKVLFILESYQEQPSPYESRWLSGSTVDTVS